MFTGGMMKSIVEIVNWPSTLSLGEFPGEAAKWMDARLMEDIIFPVRSLSGVPMWPSKLERAHVRHEASGSQHSTQNKTELSRATDFHVRDYESLVKVMAHLEQNDAVGGVGLYFDTNTPMFHVDLMESRGMRLVWVRTRDGDYVYRENDYTRFYEVLAEQLETP